jgi:predicted ATPase
MSKETKPRITGIYLENFQTLRSEPIFLNFDKLCLLYGPNSAGKSAVIDALDLIKKTVNYSYGLSEGHNYNLDNLYQKYETISQYNKLKVGVEFIAGKFDYHGEQKAWCESQDREGYDAHNFVFKKTYEKKLQVEFLNSGRGIKVAFEGEPVFEILENRTNFDNSYKKINKEKVEELTAEGNYDDWDSAIHGQLVIYKNNKLFIGTDFCNFDFSKYNKTYSNNLKKSYFFKLFFEDHDDRLTINGIKFDAQDQAEFMVKVDINTRLFLERINDHDYIHPDEYENSHDEYFNEIIFKRIELEGKDLSGEIFEQEFKIRSNNPENYLEIFNNLAEDYSKFLKGLFFQIESAIDFYHIRGDRQILNSNHCVSYNNYIRVSRDFELREEYRVEKDPLRMYAETLANESNYYYTKDLKFQGDFVNHCFQKYIPSLKGYQIEAETYDLTLRGRERVSNTLIYLRVKDKLNNNLGFQDIGSGVSYVLPIITSVWCKQLTFVEQPELHLHPRAQCELADIFNASLKFGNASVIESHSEHFLLRLSRRIRETTKGYLLPDELKLLSTDVQIYYFEPQPNGATTVKKIRLDKYGELMDRWPGGFFSERDAELFDE